MGCSPWGRKESDTTERLHFHFHFSYNYMWNLKNNIRNFPGGPVAKTAAAAAKSLQSCPTLCDAIDGSPPGSPIPGILQARTLEWVAISFSNA